MRLVVIYHGALFGGEECPRAAAQPVYVAAIHGESEFVHALARAGEQFCAFEELIFFGNAVLRVESDRNAARRERAVDGERGSERVAVGGDMAEHGDIACAEQHIRHCITFILRHRLRRPLSGYPVPRVSFLCRRPAARCCRARNAARARGACPPSREGGRG